MGNIQVNHILYPMSEGVEVEGYSDLRKVQVNICYALFVYNPIVMLRPTKITGCNKNQDHTVYPQQMVSIILAE